jgi:indolepyruvate ferredoxin oxidoreductase
MRKGFTLLAKGKVVRGTAFDPFGRTQHRREERALIGHYEQIVDELLGALSEANHEIAVEIASIPEHIRGYDLVKDAQVDEARQRETELMAKFKEVSNA